LNAYKKAWLKEAPRKEILLALSKAHEEGLNPEDYAVTRLKNFEDNFDALTTAEKNTYDILFTHHLQKYLAHLSNGKLNPNKLYSNWEIKENEIDLNATLMDLKKGEFVTEKIECLKPDHIVYKKLKKALKLVEALADESFENIRITDPINPDTTDPLLLEIKKRLLYWGDLKKKEKPTPLYDPETVKAVQCFQKRHGLGPDGIIGKETVAALNFSKQERKEQIIANLERWKWYPKNMGDEYVIINIPDYQLHLIKGKDTLRSHKVIVGRPKRPTPVLSSKLTQVIFNPTWTVPPTILREDLLPEVRKNRQYLAKLNINIYDKNGNRVPLQNWTASNASEYKYVQKPSVNNSLGVVKLNFPNRFSVYLHDTNHRDFFEKTNRSLSSGCVR
jgi:murein L,D-transpeptidase YcbB/YkuD